MLKFCFMVVMVSYAVGLQAQDFKAEIERYRAEYKDKFLKSDRSPIKADELRFLQFFDADAKFLIDAAWVPTPDAQSFDMPTYSGITKQYVQRGWLEFELDGQKYRLAAYQNVQFAMMPMYRNQLFVPFKDATNGELSYGGGRYIDLETTNMRNGKIRVDFNKAYNPWCAYGDGFNCPIPPRVNHLNIAITAGEKNYAK